MRARAIEGTPLSSARFRAVIGMSLLIMIGFGLIVPALPLYAKQFGVGAAAVGWVNTAFALTRLGGDLFAGSLIDRFGERGVTAAGALIVGVSSIAAGAAGSFTQLWVFRGIGGIGSALFLGGLMAYLIGTIPATDRGRAMSIFQASFGIGIVIGPLVGGVLIATTFVQMPLYVYGVACLLAVPLALRALGPEHVSSDALADAPALSQDGAAPGPRAPAWRRLQPLLRHSAYRAALAVSLFAFLVTASFQTVIPLLWVEELGRSEGSAGVPIAASALATLAVIWHAGSLSDRRGRKFALVPAMAVTTLAVAALGLSANAAMVVAVMVVIGAAGGYARPGPSAMVADVAPPADRGIAVSGYRIAGDIGALVGPITAGAIVQYLDYRSAFLAIAAVAAAVFVLAARAEETAPSVRAAS